MGSISASPLGMHVGMIWKERKSSSDIWTGQGFSDGKAEHCFVSFRVK